MKKTILMVALFAFVAAGWSTACAKDMNAEHMSRTRVKLTVKHQKAEAERQKARQSDSAGTADADKKSVRAR